MSELQQFISLFQCEILLIKTRKRMNTLYQIIDGDGLLHHFTPNPTSHAHFQGAKEKCCFSYSMPITTGGVPHNPSDCYVNLYLLESFFIVNNCSVCFCWITAVSASAVYALSCCRDNFWNPGWILSWGLWPFHSRNFNQFWNSVPFSMRNMLSNSSTSLPQHPTERFRVLFSFLISAFIFFQYLGNRKDWKNFFSFSYKDI